MKKDVFHFKKGEQVSNDDIASIQNAMPFEYDDTCICNKSPCECQDHEQDNAYATQNFKVIIMNYHEKKRRLKDD